MTRSAIKSVEGQILDASGSPMRASFGSAPSYAAADRFSQELAHWNPTMSDADSDLLYERDSITARSHDLARNNGWASGGLQRHLDAVIGANLRLSAKPDWRSLGLSAEWASKWSRDTEAKFRGWADDPGYYCDAARHSTLGGLLALGYRQRLVDGEALALPLWLPNRGGRYATSIQIVDPARLSNPLGKPDSMHLRAGVETDQYGAPVAYHIQKAHPGNTFALSNIADWQRVPSETRFGRRRVIHFFERERADQTRGVSIMTPIIERLKMLDRYDKVELQAAVVNAVFAAFIESPFDHDILSGALDGGSFSKYQDSRKSFHDTRKLALDGVRIPTLYPGEKFNMTTSTRPNTAFPDFERAALRYIASGFGLSYEQLSQDWSSTNYSSARAALLETWRFMSARRQTFAVGFVSQIYALWLEEAIDGGEIEIPAGAPDFYQAKAAWCRAKWIGPGRGWVDPTKEAQASQMRMDAGLSTLEMEAAEQGLDWEEVLEQRARENETMNRLGLRAPDWKIQQTETTDDGTATSTFDRRETEGA